MTKEELEKEAVTTVQWECTQMIDRPTFINGYITGAEPREKRIAELEKENVELIGKVAFLENDLNNAKAQIEKMKCDLLELRNDSYDAGMYLRIDELIQKWEIKEND